MKKFTNSLSLSALIIFTAHLAFAHCEVPCGIYDDEARIALVQEHAGTIEKSMQQIAKLSNQGEKNYNQLIRWIRNKEDHADKIQHIASQYFLTQRIKSTEPGSDKHEKYVRELEHLHQIIVHAMKCKQTTDLAHVNKLRTHLDKFAASYFGKEDAQGHEGSHKSEGSHKHEGSHNH